MTATHKVLADAGAAFTGNPFSGSNFKRTVYNSKSVYP